MCFLGYETGNMSVILDSLLNEFPFRWFMPHVSDLFYTTLKRSIFISPLQCLLLKRFNLLHYS